jgi:methylated-DNA-[protein]-cysteine S-methyltransferase
MTLVTGTYASPVGLLAFALDASKPALPALLALTFEEDAAELPARIARRIRRDPVTDAALARPLVERLDRYFAGELRALDDLPVAAAGTPFQARVWAELRRIPAGETRAYAEIADAIGASSAVRAVGAANGRNPVAIVVPCHRVVGRDGTLTGYAGGLWRKRWLLAHERAPLGPQRELFA